MSLPSCRVVIVASAPEGELPPSLVLALDAERPAVKFCETVVRRLEVGRPFSQRGPGRDHVAKVLGRLKTATLERHLAAFEKCAGA